MVERKDRELSVLEEATNFLRDNLASHPATGLIVDILNRRFVSFKFELNAAQTPLEIMTTVSRYADEGQVSCVSRIVDGWINGGNNRNRSIKREIISKDYEVWIAEE